MMISARTWAGQDEQANSFASIDMLIVLCVLPIEWRNTDDDAQQARLEVLLVRFGCFCPLWGSNEWNDIVECFCIISKLVQDHLIVFLLYCTVQETC